MGWGRDFVLLASFAISLAAWIPYSLSQPPPGHLQGGLPPSGTSSSSRGQQQQQQLPGTGQANHACGLAEFACDRGNCVSVSRFCDGTDDCGDNSDEPFGCTNCNRTLYGEVNQKYPLRLTEPFQRYSPFICNINFVAAGGDYGDIVELTFLSFQTGTLEVGRNQTMVCQKGYLQLTESAGPTDSLRSQQTRGLTQLISAMGGQPSDHVTNLFERRQEPHFGQFCGEMVGRSAAFYSDSGNVTLVVVIPSRASILTYSFSLYLTYKFIRRPVIPARTDVEPEVESPEEVDLPVEHYGTRLTHTYCDRVMVDCDRKRCKIRSPNFPGFYLRNITCRFHVKQESVPRGKKAQIVLQQTNEYKVSIFTGRTTSGTLSHRILTSDCQGDNVRVYDGNTTTSPLLVSFCGSGPLPAIVTSGPEVLVELYSAPYQFLHNSRVEIDVGVRFIESSELRMKRGRCEFVLDGTMKREGIIHSPTHTVPPNTSCVYYLRGRDTYDRVWVYFLSYFVEDRHQWSTVEKCDVSRLEIYDMPQTFQSSPFVFNPGANPSYPQQGSRSFSQSYGVQNTQGLNATDDFSYSFCEKQSPKICARATDTDGFVPRAKPCQVGSESYLSTGPDMVIRQAYFKTQELPTRQSNFVARYEFVDTRLDGIPVGPQESKGCDRVFHSSTHPEGELSSPKNLFLYGRGGRENLTCAYHFVGRTGERVKLAITRFRLISPSCRHYFDDVTSRYRCHLASKNGKAAILRATEHWSNFTSSIGCLCNSTYEDADGESSAFFESVSSNVVLQFSASFMSAVEDFHHFWFEARFEFINHSSCDTTIQRRNGSEGELAFQTPGVNPGEAPLRCRWLLEANKGKYLYLKFHGSNSYSECGSGNRFVVYSGASGPLQPISAVCVQEGQSAQKFDIFSVSWYNDTSVKGTAGVDDKLFVEAIAHRSGLFAVKWLEVTKPFLRTQSGKMLRNVNCLHECPELSACISPELWCDGTQHCPSGFDEAREHCEKFPTFYVTIGGSALLLVIVVTLVGVLIGRCGRKKKKGKANRATISDDLQLESARF